VKDYDCFYASVFENQNPKLKTVPLGVKQKGILATCNYVARRRGVDKLIQISAAKKICPELVLVDGEDLTPFRDMSKNLFAVLQSYSWNRKVERLGFDEVFMGKMPLRDRPVSLRVLTPLGADVTDIVDYNLFCLNRATLSSSFFHLARNDPEKGFTCDLTRFAGCVEGATPESVNMDVPLCVRLLLASHLAYYLRMKLETEFGFTSTCGISTNKLLSKLVGNKNKPRNQTTLLALDDETVATFIDGHVIRRIPGIGSKISRTLEAKLRPDNEPLGEHTMESRVTAGEVRTHPDISPGSLEVLLAGPGAEKGIGEKVWGFLHGVDASDVKNASDVPSQISIEDTYRSLDTLGRITEELHKLSMSLIRRMRVDLVVDDDSPHREATQRWLARPKTLRLSIGVRPPADSDSYMSRTSKSAALPSFVFSLQDEMDQLADRLVGETVLPLLRRFQSGKEHKWDLSLLNICVTNMVQVGSDDRGGSGRDIAVMFKTQDEVLKPYRADPLLGKKNTNDKGPVAEMDFGDGDNFQEIEWDTSWEGQGEGERCPLCGYYIPLFAIEAHLRYHELGDQ